MRKILRTNNWRALNKVFLAFGGPFFDALAASCLGFEHAYRQAHIAVAMHNAQLAIDNADSKYDLHGEDLANHDNFKSVVTDDRLILYWTSRSNKSYEIRADRDTQEVSIEFDDNSSLAELFEDTFADEGSPVTQVGNKLSRFGLYATLEEEQHIALGDAIVLVQDFTHDKDGNQIDENIDDQYFCIYIAQSEEDMGQGRVMTTYNKYTVRSAQEISNLEFGALAHFIATKYGSTT